MKQILLRCKKLWLPVIMCPCLFWGYKFYQQQFGVENITLSSMPTETAAVDENQYAILKALVAQPFTYLDRGEQTYVFASQDGRYVLKFFDTNQNYAIKMTRLIEGYRVAYENDRENTGIVFLQLTPSNRPPLKVQLTDRFGLKHEIDLSLVPFVVQERAIATRHLLTQLLQEKRVLEAKQHLRLIIDMYLKEYFQGIFDRDHNFMHNTGFIEQKPVRIDVGRLRLDESFKNPAKFLPDLHKIAILRLGGWLDRHFPAYKDDILADMHLKLEAIMVGEAHR